jgi:fucose permease
LKPALLGIAFLSFASIGLQGGALSVAWLHMQATFGKTLESLGILLAAITIGGLVVNFFGGRIMDRLGIGWFCLLGGLSGAVGLLITGTTASWSGLVFAALLLGAGRAGINTGVNTFVAHRYATSRMNWLHAVFGLGSALGPLLVTFIAIELARPWQSSYLILAGFHLSVTMLFAVTLKHWRLATGQDENGTNVRGPSIGASLSLLPVWLGITLFVSHTGIQLSTGQLTNNLFVEGRNIDPKVAGIWISLFWGFITLGRLLFGPVIDRVGAAPVLRVCTFGTVIGALLLWWNPFETVSFLGLALMGFTIAPIFPTSVSRTPGLVGLEHAPNAIGFQMAGAALGSALLPGLVGFISDHLGLALIPPSLVLIALAQFTIHELVTRQETRQLKEHDPA